jgi:outer membrane protein assembly factor BamB
VGRASSDSAQIITLALPFVISYAAADGAELWRADVLDGEVTPSAVFAGGQVIAVSPSAKLLALRPDGSGDVTQSHVNWAIQEYLPDISSPVSDGEFVFTVTSSGLLACFDAQDGKKVWEHDFEIEVQASPSIAGGNLYLLGTHGEVVIAKSAREFSNLGREQLEDEFYASPAFANGKMILRGNKNVWCFGAKEVAHAD